MLTLVLALRGAAAIGVLGLLVGGVPRLAVLGLAVIGGLWTGMLVDVPPIGDGVLVVAARELVIGASLGIVAALPLVAAALAGRLVDSVAAARGTYRGFFGVLAAAVFVGIDGHVMLVTTIVDSHRDAPAVVATLPRVLDAIGALFAAGLRLAVPWLVTAVVVELAVGAGMRVAARSAAHVPSGAAVPAALAMITAALVGTLAVAIAATIRGAWPGA